MPRTGNPAAAGKLWSGCTRPGAPLPAKSLARHFLGSVFRLHRRQLWLFMRGEIASSAILQSLTRTGIGPIEGKHPPGTAAHWLPFNFANFQLRISEDLIRTLTEAKFCKIGSGAAVRFPSDPTHPPPVYLGRFNKR